MYVGHRNGGKTYVDLMGKQQREVLINDDGWGEFWTNGGSVSVWIAK